MRRLALLALALAAWLAPAASAQEGSANVERIASVPEMVSAIALNFIDDTMFVSTAHGVYAYDVSDPQSPALLGALPMYIWENEDMDVDVDRKRLFISRDPRGFTSPAIPGDTFPFGAVHIIDVSNPHAMTQVGFFTVLAGHTSTCVNDCDFLWTGGPYANAAAQPDFTGRPIYATDVTDPGNPRPCPEPIDTGRNDGVTDYVHDVQVDSRGVAWVSGVGGVRGYWTSGVHRNPLTGEMEAATGCEPIPYAGSGTPEGATPSRFMHNSHREPDAAWLPTPAPQAAPAPAAKRPVRCKRKRTRAQRRRCRKAKRRAARRPTAPTPAPAPPARPLAERILFGTEENLSSDCAASGRFVAYDLEGTFEGQGFRDIDRTRHRMTPLDTWTPEGAEGASGCDSAHYFASRGDGIFANAFYRQGVRFLDVSNPRDIRQVGWFRPENSNAFAVYWRKGLVFVADFTRGVEILRFSGSRRSRTVRAPVVPGSSTRLRFRRGHLGGVCPLPD